MPDSYTLRELIDILGVRSITVVRNRVRDLRDYLEEQGWLVFVPPNGAIGITPEGVNLLQRYEELVRSGRTVHRALDDLMTELGVKDEPVDHRVRLLEAQLKRVERRVSALENRRPWWMKLLALKPPGDAN